MNLPYKHPTAIVETDDIGENTKIWAYVHVMKGVKIGANCNIGDHCFFEAGVVVGDNVTIKNGNMLWEGVTLEDGVFVGPHVFFTNDLFPRSPRLAQAKKRYETHEWFSPTLVKRGATLGAGAVILADNEIGEYAMVAAGAVVTKDVAPYTLVAGNPARVKGWVCQCGRKLRFDNNTALCVCGLAYEQREAPGGVRACVLRGSSE